MSESVPTENRPPTKLTLFYSPLDKSNSISNSMTNLPHLVQQLGYNFSFEMPTVHCKNETPEPTIETYTNWRGKIRERKVYQNTSGFRYYHYLQFSRELTEEELKFWRIFKLGFLSREMDSRGLWRAK